jgi:hypothetical protein
VGLVEELERIAAAAAAHGGGGALVAVLATEPAPGARRYLCAYEPPGPGPRAWLALDGSGAPVADRDDVRAAAAIAALCEVAAECAFPGDLDELLAQVVALRVAEQPPGIEEAEDAVRALQHALGAPPALATPERLDAIGTAARRLERALDPAVPSPFAAAMQAAQGAVDALVREIEEGYLLPPAGGAQVALEP